MGIDFSHCEAHWSYSGFNRFRTRLAAEIGIDLDSMDGHGGVKPWEEVDDAIKPLLDHSDCDGELSWEECARVAPRLRELSKNLDNYDKAQALELADGMEQACLNEEPLIFC